MRFGEIIQELEALETLKQRIKRRAMTYQVDLKEQIAKSRGLPISSYYDLTYQEWSKIRDERR